MDSNTDTNGNEEDLPVLSQIVITLNVERKFVNVKNIYFLDNAAIFKDGEYLHKEHLPEITPKTAEFYINGERYDFKKSFLATKEGIYTVTIKLKTTLTDCSYMFTSCHFITHIDLSNFDTKNVVNMKRMFYDCDNLESINLTNFNTRYVTNMECMFGNCKRLREIDLSLFDTKNVGNMKNMFNNCKCLTNLDFRNFDTSKVFNMQCMFYGCENLESLDLSNWNTANVNNMLSLFDGCYKLNSINVTTFNTQKVTTMEKMFNCCYNLTSLDLTSFNFENCYNKQNFLYGCDKIKIVKTNKKALAAVKEEVNPHNFVKVLTE